MLVEPLLFNTSSFFFSGRKWSSPPACKLPGDLNGQWNTADVKGKV